MVRDRSLHLLSIRFDPYPGLPSLTLAYIPEHLISGKGWANRKEVHNSATLSR